MTEQYLNELNSKLYPDAKIREKQGYFSNTYTSTVWETLKKQGFKMTHNKSLCTIRDYNKNVIVQEIGLVNALYQLGYIMR